MKRIICSYFIRYFIHIVIFLTAIITISYLIMVSSTRRIFQINYMKVQLFDVIRTNEIQGIEKVVQSSQLLKPVSQESIVKVILVWSPMFKEFNFFTSNKNSFRYFGCLETRCEITSDRNRLLESDAVLFHIRTLSMFDLPRNRTQAQKWIFFTLESPPYSRFHGLDFMENMFNWTMTYRKDSDVFIPYGSIVFKTNKQERKEIVLDLRQKWRKKTKMAVWMVSHCSTEGQREKYIKQLSSIFDIDTFGSCGSASCSFNKTNLCIEQFSKQYHFYLAFENAICDDYITEKLFRTLQYDMIPVVFGGGNYKEVAPPNSYIDALGFSSPKDLARHLLQVASNFTSWSSYFNWRSDQYSDDIPKHCELCRKLHSGDFSKYSTYSDINYWWIKKSNCRTWKKSLRTHF